MSNNWQLRGKWQGNAQQTDLVGEKDERLANQKPKAASSALLLSQDGERLLELQTRTPPGSKLGRLPKPALRPHVLDVVGGVEGLRHVEDVALLVDDQVLEVSLLPQVDLAG
jgi:hypothetical protein